MATPHINANPGDFAKVVLMPGDPLRAQWIADTFLHDVKLVNTVRGCLGFTGYTKNGKRVSVMASGMGQPSIGIYSYELFTVYDVEVIMRVGTCGSYQEDINLLDVIIGTTASTNSNWASQYGIVGAFSAGADFKLAMEAYKQAQRLGIPTHEGSILSSDPFYTEDKTEWQRWKKLGVLGVEMESYALYCNAARLNKKALCLLSVSDSFVKEGILSSEERQTGLNKMIDIAIATAEVYAD